MRGRSGCRGFGAPEFPLPNSQTPGVGEGVRSRRTRDSGAQAAFPVTLVSRGAGLREGQEMNLGDAWSGWRVGGACTLGLPQRREMGMDRSACGSSRSPLPSGRSDSDIWDSTPLQAEVTKLPPSSLLSSGPDDRKSSVQVVRGHLGWRVSFSTRTY